MAVDPCVFPLKCAVQEYAWGKIGNDSQVARLAANANPDFRLQPQTTYAELWMGTHPNGPSCISLPGVLEQPLEEWIKAHPEKLGAEANEYFKGQLSFIFKVLSVRTSLSIQAHPNKVHATFLHKEFPDIYKDPNHKPEMAIALTPFEGLCGFRRIQEVSKFLQDIQEFRTVVGNDKAVKLVSAAKSVDMPLHGEAMKDCFEALMKREKTVIAKELRKWIDKIEKMKKNGEDITPYMGHVLLKLNSEFPDDVGCFSVYFLNHITLQPGQAMFLDANLPHAYLSGDCMECMACSDNVVRAGLTPKYIDVHTLCKMLNYSGKAASKSLFHGRIDTEDPYVTVFSPSVADFAVIKIQLPENVVQYELKPLTSASICIIIEGSCQGKTASLVNPLELTSGSVIFISVKETITLKINNGGMLLFRAYTNL